MASYIQPHPRVNLIIRWFISTNQGISHIKFNSDETIQVDICVFVQRGIMLMTKTYSFLNANVGVQAC